MEVPTLADNENPAPANAGGGIVRWCTERLEFHGVIHHEAEDVGIDV